MSDRQMNSRSDPLIESWCSRINAAWDKYGDGKPLEPAIVESMAMAFSQPVELPRTSFRRDVR